MISTFPAIILQTLSKAAFNPILQNDESTNNRVVVKYIQLIYRAAIFVLCVFFLVVSLSFVLISFFKVTTDGIFSLMILKYVMVGKPSAERAFWLLMFWSKLQMALHGKPSFRNGVGVFPMRLLLKQ